MVQLYGDTEHLLLFTTVDGENLMPLQTGKVLREIIVQRVYGILFCRCFRVELSNAIQQGLQCFAQLGTVADLLGDDIRGTGQRVFNALHTLFWVYIIFCSFFRSRAVPVLTKEQLGQWVKPFFFRNGGTGTTLLLIGTVKILELCEGSGLPDGSGKFIGELALLLNGGENGVAPFLKIAQVLQPSFQRAQCCVVHGPVQFLAVTGDERNGVALIQQTDDIFHILAFLTELFRQN